MCNLRKNCNMNTALLFTLPYIYTPALPSSNPHSQRPFKKQTRAKNSYLDSCLCFTCSANTLSPAPHHSEGQPMNLQESNSNVVPFIWKTSSTRQNYSNHSESENNKTNVLSKDRTRMLECLIGWRIFILLANIPYMFQIELHRNLIRLLIW